MEQLYGPRPHRLTAAQFDAISSAAPVEPLITLLQRIWLSRTLLLIKHVAGQHGRAARPGVSVLADAYDANPIAVREVLRNPWVGVWAAEAARQPGNDRHVNELNALALAACALSGVRGRSLPLAPSKGSVMIPGLGMLHLSSESIIALPDLNGQGWQPIRRTVAESRKRRLTLTIDDLDPFRDCHGTAVAPRLSEPNVDRLTHIVNAGWALLCESCPARADELASGVMSIAPLLDGQPGAHRSATNSAAFGGFASTIHSDPAEFAATLVHEFQHSKLNALSSLIPICDFADAKTYFAPWRLDPRPLNGLLHGIYAFTGVAAFWRNTRRLEPLAKRATAAFALIRSQLRSALEEAQASTGLTAAGRRLLTNLSITIDHFDGVPLPRTVVSDAEAAVADARGQWLRTHRD